MIDRPRKGDRVLVRTAGNSLEKAVVVKSGVDGRGRFPTVWVELPVDRSHGAQPWPVEDVFSDLQAARERVAEFAPTARVIPFRPREARNA
jgi:hypothetical protein